MDKLNYRKDLLTETLEQVSVGTYEIGDSIFIKVIDKNADYAIVTLTLKEAQRVKRYLEDAITTNIINWEEE